MKVDVIEEIKFGYAFQGESLVFLDCSINDKESLI